MDLTHKYNFDNDIFDKLRNEYISGAFSEKNNKLSGTIAPPEECNLFNLDKLDHQQKEKYSECAREAISSGKLGYVIVNGGMSTRFGSVVKGIVKVFDDKSFLQIKLEQIKRINHKYSTSISVFIMNSFATEEATRAHLEENDYFGMDKNKIHFFNQFISKRLHTDGSYFKVDGHPNQSFYGPGHGDFVYAFRKEGCIDKFINEGGEYLWYSNVDNLGATINVMILGYHIENRNEMTVEVAQKYPGDKGGVPALVDGRIQLVEEFMIPSDFDQNSIQVFNTATYIFTAKSLRKEIKLPWYLVRKKVHGNEAIQFERLTGDLSSILKSGYVIINREERFFPIKTPEDLEKQREKLKHTLRQHL